MTFERSEFFAVHVTAYAGIEETFAVVYNDASMGFIDLADGSIVNVQLGPVVASYIGNHFGEMDVRIVCDAELHPNGSRISYASCPPFKLLGELCIGSVDLVAPSSWFEHKRNLDNIAMVTRGMTANIAMGYSTGVNIVTDVCCACGNSIIRYVSRDMCDKELFDDAIVAYATDGKIDEHVLVNMGATACNVVFGVCSYARLLCDYCGGCVCNSCTEGGVESCES